MPPGRSVAVIVAFLALAVVAVVRFSRPAGEPPRREAAGTRDDRRSPQRATDPATGTAETRAATAPPAPGNVSVATGQPRETERLPENMAPAQAWKNAGRATPSAAFETLLWAAAGGDVEGVASGIALDSSAQATAETIFANLPEPARAQAGSAQRLIALLLTQYLPSTGAMQMIGPTTRLGPDEVERMVVQLRGADGAAKNLALPYRRHTDGWRAVITPELVEVLAQMRPGSLTPATRGG